MTRIQKDNTGALFQNHKKTSDNQPGWKGQCRVEGVDYWISSWVKTTDAGEKFISLAFKRKDKERVQQKIDKQL